MQYPNAYIEQVIEESSSVFKGLTQKEKEVLIGQHSVLKIKKGQFLFRKGEKVKGLVCLASGKAKVYNYGVGGRGQIIKMVRQHGFIGYRSLFSDGGWPFSAIAIEDSYMCVFDKKLLQKGP